MFMTAERGKSFHPKRIRRIWRGTLIGILIGVVSGLGAILFNFLLQTGTRFFMQDLIGFVLPASATGRYFLGVPVSRWVIACVPAVGGLISGLIVFSFAPEAEGHGTDAMIDAFHRKKGIIRRRVPVVKTIASAITIGSGGSAGKEGPIAQIGAGFGSFLASILKVSDRERRVMLLAGAAGGLGAIFKAPLGSALFVTEVLYSKEAFEFEAIIPCILSSIMGFMIFTYYEGSDTIFHIPRLALATPAQLPFYGALGVLCTVVGLLYVRVFYGMRDRFFKRINLPSHVKPAIGGLMLGLLAVFLPQVLGGGYPLIQSAIDGQLAVPLMAALIFAKIFATSFTISSGGSGGVFAPSLFIGAMLGGAFGGICHTFFPHIVTEPSAFVLVGIGGFFAGVAKVPIAALIMVAEMTGGYSLIVPMMIVSSLSYLLLGNVSLYEKQVPTRVDSPAHIGDFAVDVMEHLRVKDAVLQGRDVQTIRENMPFEQILQFMLASNQQDFPVVDEDENLTGIISMTDLRQAMADKEVHNLLLARDIAMGGATTVTMDDTVNTALGVMADLDVRELPVVSKDDPRKVIALVSRKDITRAYHEEMERVKGPSAPARPHWTK
jgi:CIC family chloride channel protein